MVKVAKQTKGVGKPSAAKVAADKRKRQEEHLRKAQEKAFEKARKQRLILASRVAGRAAADAEIAKKGGKRK